MSDQRTVAQFLDHWAAQSPEQIGIEVSGLESLTFAQWLAESNALGHAIAAHGSQVGDRVGFLGKNTARWGVVMTAASRVRAIGIPLNWRLSSVGLQQVVEDADPLIVVAEAEFLPLLGLPRPADDGLHVVSGQSATPYAEWVSPLGSVPPAVQPDPEDIVLMIYTSGTSGVPKGVELANRAISTNLSTTAPWDIRAGDTVMVPAPNFHLSGSGWVFYCLALGASSLFLSDIRADDVLELFGSGRVTHSLTVPAVVQMLVQHPEVRTHDFSGLRTLIYGGSPISATVADAAREIFGCDLIQSYGMTETCGPITFLAPEDHRAGGELMTSAGRPVPEIEVGVFNPVTAERCPPMVKGEVWTRSAMLLSGYRNRPEELADVLTADGWFRTGDGGYFNEAGYLFLRDRVKDMIVSGGENVFPVEIENVLMSHPKVLDVAAIGVPSEKWGETVKAIVVRSDPSTTADELIAFCRETLAHYKCPTSVDFVDELPRNPSGKILKRVLREPFWADRDREIA